MKIGGSNLSTMSRETKDMYCDGRHDDRMRMKGIKARDLC